MKNKPAALALVLLLQIAPAVQAGTEGTYSTFFGTNAGSSNSNDTNHNTFFGSDAGKATSTGLANTFVGRTAGYLNTTGYYNTYVGDQAGFNDNIGAYNTYLGYFAGRQGLNANNNTFVGAVAGQVNTTGHENTFLGTAAGYNNATGAANTFVGANAGVSNVSGYRNTYVGMEAGYLATNNYNTYLGYQAGYSTTAGDSNVFVGDSAGYSVTNGFRDTIIGDYAGHGVTSGFDNTVLGDSAGYNLGTGHGNVLIGTSAGYSETGSNKLYIDNCYVNDFVCANPLIYGEFDNHLLKINGATNVAANGVAKSQMHFSLANADSGGFLTSVAENNFFMSSGARYDGTAGGWKQLSSDNKATVAGSGGLGYRIFADSGHTVGSNFTPTVRLHIDYNGNLGLNQLAVSGTPIQHSSGAHLTAGGVWTDASSREYKDNIHPLTTEEAQQTLAALDPVRYNYKVNPLEKHVGFIAEDVPELVAREDRKSLSPMDIVAVLTKVVQEQRREIDAERTARQRLEARLSAVLDRIEKAGIGR